jgi:hypothetical protein
VSLNANVGLFGAIVVALANFGPSITSVALNVSDISSVLPSSGQWEMVVLDQRSLRLTTVPHASCNFIPAESLAVISMPLGSTHVSARRVGLHEFFAPEVTMGSRVIFLPPCFRYIGEPLHEM